MKVRKAVIPVAGLGTRLLPATKVIPKELVPVVARPSIEDRDQGIHQGPIQRMFGIANVLIETAGGGGAVDPTIAIPR